jgi:hypothetical protein
MPLELCWLNLNKSAPDDVYNLMVYMPGTKVLFKFGDAKDSTRRFLFLLFFFFFFSCKYLHTDIQVKP